MSPETPARGEPAAGSCTGEEQGEQEAQVQLRHHQGAERQYEETGEESSHKRRDCLFGFGGCLQSLIESQISVVQCCNIAVF